MENKEERDREKEAKKYGELGGERWRKMRQKMENNEERIGK